MACFKSLSFCLVTAFLFFSCVLFSFSLGEQARLPATSGKYGEKNSGMVFSWGRIERFLAESDEPPVNSTLVLAAKRTYRKDPLNNFEKYRGGWNISEGHYWASVAFTAAPFFVIAAAWFLLFALCLLIICLRHCCCRKEPYGYSRIAYALSLILLILFTIAAMYFLHTDTDTDIYKYIKFAVGSTTYCLNSWSLTFKKEQVGIQPVLHDRNNPIYVKWPSNLWMYNFLKLGFASQHGFMTIYLNIGCVVLYTGQGKYHSSTANTLDYVVHQANITSEKLRNVSEYLSAAKKVGVNQMFLPSNVQSDIDRIQTKINSSASTLATTAEDNSNDIKNLIDSVRLALIILSAIMLILTFLGFVFSLFGMQFLVYILVILGWILVTGTFILCGIFLLLHNVTADTCVAMDQWVQNPTAHTALDDILPCVDNATAQETLTRTKEVTSQLANIMNFVVNNVSNINFPPNVPTLYFNQSGPLLPSLCNPFNPDLTDRTCQPGEVDLENATQVWNNYVCDVSPNGICFTTGRLTPRFYSQMAAGVNISYGLYKYGPFLVDLQDCTFVRQTFTDIDQTYCPGLRRYSSWIYIGLVMVATAVMLSLLFWVIYGRERKHRVYTKEHTPRFTEGYEGGKP